MVIAEAGMRVPENGVYQVSLTFQGYGTVLVETAPVDLMPHAVWLFLRIVKRWKGGSLHRNAGHVLQFALRDNADAGPVQHLAFQEYSAQYPHVKYTLGFAGRPGGPAFYISTIDNTRNHGPGSQGSATEADACFGRVVQGHGIVDKIQAEWASSPHEKDRNGFVKDTRNWIPVSLDLLETEESTDGSVD